MSCFCHPAWLPYKLCTYISHLEGFVQSKMTFFVVNLQANVTEHVPKIFDAVFECTLEMINKVSERWGL